MLCVYNRRGRVGIALCACTGWIGHADEKISATISVDYAFRLPEEKEEDIENEETSNGEAEKATIEVA